MKERKIGMAMMLCFVMVAPMVNAQTETTHAFSIQQAVEYAKKNNVQVKNALLDIQIQEQTNKGITASAYPTIGGVISYTNNIEGPTQLFPAALFGGTGYMAGSFAIKHNANALLQLQQLLFDGQVFVGLQARDASMEFARKNVDVTEEAIKVNIYKIYYQLVVSKTQIDLLDANIERLEKLKHDVGEMFKNGFAERLDVDKLDVQLVNLKTEKQKALNTVDVGYYGLKTLMGMPAKDSLILTDKIADSDIKTGILADSATYTDRQDYQYLEILRRLNQYNIKRYKLAYLPTLAGTATYGKQAYRPKFTFFEKGDWYDLFNFGINLSVPIFSGFSKDAKLKQSRIELQKTENNINNLKLSIDNEVASAKLKIKSAIETMDFQKRNMELAEKVYGQTKKKFEAGLGSNTEINTAQTDLKTAQTSYIQALYDAIIAKVDFLKATGKL